jgi:hypothetical protein
MSDLMLLGVLQMPVEMVMSSDLTMLQYVHRGHEAARRIKADAAIIEQQADQILDARRTAEYWKAEHNAANARIAELEAQLAAVAPAVDAQPVAWFIADDNGEVYRATGYEHERDQWRAVGHAVFPLYASAQSEGLRKDAERYRWLRDEGDLSVRDVFGSWNPHLNDGLDAAIDAALSQHKAGEKDD